MPVRRRTLLGLPFAIGMREFFSNRGDRQLTTHIHYPAAGTSGGTAWDAALG